MDRNKVEIAGRLTRDPDIKRTASGSVITELGLATNRKYRKDDETHEETTFIDVTFFGRQAEVVGKYLKKGEPIFIDGRLKLDSWEHKETGKTRTKLKVVGESFTFVGGGRGRTEERSPEPRQPAKQTSPAISDDEDEEIPF
jgi:single-strand DNA-binding protein